MKLGKRIQEGLSLFLLIVEYVKCLPGRYSD
jgi:hypothetical protein